MTRLKRCSCHPVGKSSSCSTEILADGCRRADQMRHIDKSLRNQMAELLLKRRPDDDVHVAHFVLDGYDGGAVFLDEPFSLKISPALPLIASRCSEPRNAG